MKNYLAIATASSLLTSAFFWGVQSFKEVRRESELKAILGNLRQIASAADQYFLETKAESVSYEKLLEDEYFRRLQPALGENYQMTIHLSDDEICVRIPDGFYSVCINL